MGEGSWYRKISAVSVPSLKFCAPAQTSCAGPTYSVVGEPAICGGGTALLVSPGTVTCPNAPAGSWPLLYRPPVSQLSCGAPDVERKPPPRPNAQTAGK